jgi:hypothetical protein
MKMRGHNSGYVLILVLVVLAIAGMVLGASAARHGKAAIRASVAQRNLQLRWGDLSVASSVLPLAQQMLRTAADGKEAFPVSVTRRVSLGGMDFDLLLSDEQAKANVNLILARKGLVEVEAAVSALQADQPRALAVRLRPQAPEDRAIRRYPLAFGSYAQVFAVKQAKELVDDGFGELSAPARVTCWGSGRVHFQAADAAVLRAILAGVLNETQMDELRKYRKEQPDCTLEEALRHLKLTKEKADEARKLLTDESSCQALWVIARCGTRDWHTLHVAQSGDAENDAQSWMFRW